MIRNISYNLLEEFSRKHIPLTLLIEVTKRCNWKCGFCYAECDNNDGLSNELLFSVIREFKELGTFNITFTGGEPFLKKDFWDLVEYTKSLGFALNVNTNGSLIHHFDISKISKYFANINISLHSLESQRHDEVVGVKNAWQTTVNNLIELKKHGANVCINTLITSQMANQYKEMEHFITKELGLKWNPDFSISPTYSGKTEHLSSYYITDDALEKISERNDTSSNVAQYQKNDITSSSNGICRAGSGTCFLDADGYLYPCLSFKRNGMDMLNGVKWLQNINDTSVHDIWENNYLFNYLRNVNEEDFKKCISCDLRNLCFKCMADNYIETGSPIIPSEQYCKKQYKLCNR